MKLTWKSVLISGMGVFSDGYNLYSLSLMIYTISAFIPMTKITEGLLVAGSYLGAAVSALLFGLISDIEGRKKMYGIDVTLMAIGAALQALSQNYSELFLSRLLLGMGVGADYVLSPIIVAENAEKQKRGRAMVITFAVMWGLGAVLAAFVDQLTLQLPQSLAWRIVLGLGAVPALSVIFARRKLTETLLFLSKVRPDEKEIRDLEKEGVNVKIDIDKGSFRERFMSSLFLVIISAVLWLLYDIYSSTFAIYGPITIAYNLGITPIMFTYIAQFFAGIPGQLLCIFLIDKIGRKPLIVIGYTGVSIWLILYSLLLLDPSLFGLYETGKLTGEGAVLGLTFYMLNYLFSAMGPASIIGSGMVTPELVHTKIRGTSQAISVAVDRTASATVISLFPSLVSIIGLGGMVGIYGIVALLSALITLFLVPETKGQELDRVKRVVTKI
ncbi:MFS transporter [Stygiolobus caldivivus]|uniref:MFS transporter n=1 Tax=Stygiolobus caldivivus TaxID=2824673 RepID=A0A8D5U8D2_9CREN|nr:MFS transporter [Stygiolobus caldivivus]BCU71082.1 MFS transporter [Stygiolobus caldivivus]